MRQLTLLLLSVWIACSTLNAGTAVSSVVAWGNNCWGQTNVPPELTNAVAIAVGENHSLALRSDGIVVAWGTNDYGQLQMPWNLANVVAIAAGKYHNLALKVDGNVVAWGATDYGQLKIPPGLANVAAIAAGDNHNLAVRSNGTVVAWGMNKSGATNVPLNLTNVISAAAGSEHSLVLKRDGTVVGWGKYSPPKGSSVNLSNVVAISASWYHSLALKRDGTVLWWNDYGDVLQTPGGLSNVVSIACSRNCCFAVHADGKVTAWRTGFPGFFEVPMDLANIVAVAPGSFHSLALVWKGPPRITALPRAPVSYLGATAQIAVQAIGETPLEYQWQHNGEVIPGATNAALILTDLARDQAGDYRVMIRNRFGQTISDPIGLEILEVPPLILNQPSSQTVLRGGPMKMSVLVEGSPPYRYQWQFNGIDLDGATNPALTLAQTELNHRGQYRVLISNPYGATTSSNAALEVLMILAWGDNQYGKTNVPCGLTNVTAIAVGGVHSVALKGDGKVVSWGYPLDGITNVPKDLSNVTAIAAGDMHTLALKADGTVTAWGDNFHGQCQVPRGLTNVISIAACWWGSLALKNEGTVVTWGTNYSGKAPVPTGLSNVVSIKQDMALLRDGTVVFWDYYDGSIQTNGPPNLTNVVAIDSGNSRLALRNDGTVVAWERFGNPIETPPEATNVVAIAASGYHNLALQADGMVVAWLYEYDYAKNVYIARPTMVADLMNVVAIAGGFTHNLALIGDGSPVITVHPVSRSAYHGTTTSFIVKAVGSGPLHYQWLRNGKEIAGANQSVLNISNLTADEVGNYQVRVWNVRGETLSPAAHLTTMDGPPRILRQPPDLQVLKGASAQLGIIVEGTVPMNFQWRCDGNPITGGIGPIFVITNSQPAHNGVYSVMVSNVFGFVASSNAVLDVTSVATWGNSYGSRTPIPGGLTNVIAVAAGGAHNLALNADGTVVAWGWNVDGFGNYAGQSDVPAGLTDVVAIAAGGMHNLALRADGTVIAWGANDYGQKDFPPGLTGVVAIAAGGGHSVALKEDGSVVACGDNSYHQTEVPSAITNAVAVAAGGFYHLLALRADGTVMAWGETQRWGGQVPLDLGEVASIQSRGMHNMALKVDGTVVAWGDYGDGQTNVPPGLTSVIAISSGGNHNLALLADGTVKAWGYSSRERWEVPEGLSNVVAIAAGGSHSLVLVSDSRPSISLELFAPYVFNKALTIPFSTHRGKAYYLESKDILADAHWQWRRTLVGDGSVKSFTDSITSAGTRFYRVRQLP
ncbi:MAG: immunoglobulin domain-containing protein [Candidatus Omnitrophica bacterium]|nr:immunoglobulin domain-containing protein [Candidatus Omnitrophota bacterium]